MHSILQTLNNFPKRFPWTHAISLLYITLNTACWVWWYQIQQSKIHIGESFLAVLLLQWAIFCVYLLLGATGFIIEYNLNLKKQSSEDKPLLYDYIFGITLILELASSLMQVI